MGWVAFHIQRRLYFVTQTGHGGGFGLFSVGEAHRHEYGINNDMFGGSLCACLEVLVHLVRVDRGIA